MIEDSNPIPSWEYAIGQAVHYANQAAGAPMDLRNGLAEVSQAWAAIALQCGHQSKAQAVANWAHAFIRGGDEAAWPALVQAVNEWAEDLGIG